MVGRAAISAIDAATDTAIESWADRGFFSQRRMTQGAMAITFPGVKAQPELAAPLVR